MNLPTTKLCTKCGTTKDAASFYASAKRPDGLSSYCRVCQIADAQARYTAHPRNRAREGMKYCPKCRSTQPLDCFGSNRGQHDGKQPYCKPCSVAAVTASRHKDPTSHRRSSKAWRERNLDRHADNNAKRNYGVEHGTYAKMFAAQGGRCAICGTTEPGGTATRFAIDHCHDTGDIRGLLCSGCNNGIGRFKHDVETIKRAAAYLEQPPAQLLSQTTCCTR